MKELTIEEGALDVVRQMVADGQVSQEVAEKYFPELKESEDERIKRDIIETLRYGLACEESVLMPGATTTLKEATAWIEKQGKNNMGISEANKQKLEDNLNKALEKETPESCNEFLEKQGEQILANSAKTCKDEPKFKIGDIIHKIGENTIFPMVIEKIKNGEYVCDNNHSFINIKFQDDYELVEQNPTDRVELVEQKPAWSEDDEKGFGDALWCCKQAASIAKDENDMGNAWYAENWLKSLKDRYTWKPSDEQMADLWNMVCECRPADQQLLQDIYYGLKTLRGE